MSGAMSILYSLHDRSLLRPLYCCRRFPGINHIPTRVDDASETLRPHVGIHHQAELQGKSGVLVVIRYPLLHTHILWDMTKIFDKQRLLGSDPRRQADHAVQERAFFTGGRIFYPMNPTAVQQASSVLR